MPLEASFKPFIPEFQDIRESARPHHDPSVPPLKNPARKQKSRSRYRRTSMESTDITGISKAGALDHDHSSSGISASREKAAMSSAHAVDEEAMNDANPEASPKRTTGRSSRVLRILDLVTGIEAMAMCGFALVFYNVRLEGAWHEVSRKHLNNTTLIVILILVLLLMTEQLITQSIRRRYPAAQQESTVLLLHINYVQFITAAFRVVAPCVGAIFIVAHS